MDNELPADIEKRINEQFDRHTCSNGMRIDIKKFVSEVISEYATKLHQAEQEHASKLHDAEKKIRSLSSVIGIHKRTADRVISELFEARALLEKFISRHEGGLLPDMFIYEEIKKFLDGK
jgi:hypothetical protein